MEAGGGDVVDERDDGDDQDADDDAAAVDDDDAAVAVPDVVCESRQHQHQHMGLHIDQHVGAPQQAILACEVVLGLAIVRR